MKEDDLKVIYDRRGATIEASMFNDTSIVVQVSFYGQTTVEKPSELSMKVMFWAIKAFCASVKKEEEVKQCEQSHIANMAFQVDAFFYGKNTLYYYKIASGSEKKYLPDTFDPISN